MTVDVIYSDTSDGYVYEVDPTWANIQAGTGPATAYSATYTAMLCGSRKPFSYYTYQAFVQFNTSGIGSDTVSSAILSLYGSTDNSVTDFTVQARAYDWGTSYGTTNFRSTTQMAALTLLAHFATSGYSSSGYNVFTNDAFPANINKTGQTKIILSSDRFLTTAPTGNEYVYFLTADNSGTTLDPYLTITHAAAGGKTLKVRRSSAWTAGAVKVRRSGAWVDPTAIKVRRSGAWVDAT